MNPGAHRAVVLGDVAGVGNHSGREVHGKDGRVLASWSVTTPYWYSC